MYKIFKNVFKKFNSEMHIEMHIEMQYHNNCWVKILTAVIKLLVIQGVIN